VRPFGPNLTTSVDFGYYLVCLNEVAENPDVCAFRQWALTQAKTELSVGADRRGAVTGRQQITILYCGASVVWPLLRVTAER